MKKAIYAIVLLTAVSLLWGAISTPVRVARATPANPPVYDTKQLPGGTCRVVACSFIPTTVNALQQLTMYSGPHAISVQGLSAATDTCDVSCPILRDRYQDGVGPRGAWLDVALTPLAPPGNNNRQISCHLEDTTGTYSLNGFVKNWTASGDSALSAIPVDGSVGRLNLAIPYPNVPTEPWSHGATYANGYSVIVCTMPIFSRIEGYGWSEYAGESTDY